MKFVLPLFKTRNFLNIFSFLIFTTFISLPVFAESTLPGKKVRVGWYSSSLFQEGISDEEPKSGYCYEYLQKIASYNGWAYTYVYGEWPELLDKLRKGEIDIMGGVSDTPERRPYMLFPNYIMGTDIFYLYQHDENQTMNISDLTTFKGQKIGAIKDNLMSFYLETWIKEKNVDLNVIYYDGFAYRDHDFSLGIIDGVVATDNNILSNSGYSMVSKVGADPYYLAVSKFRVDLLQELNNALAILEEMDPYFLQNLQYSSYGSTLTNVTMSKLEKNWLATHNTLTVGYLNNYLPYCDSDKDNNATGLITDVLSAALRELNIQDQLKLQYKKFDNYKNMITSLQNDSIDIAFPIGGSGWNQEQDGIDASNIIVSAGMDLVYKGKYQKDETGNFAVNKNNKMMYYFIKNNYPDSEIIEYDSIEDCLDAVCNGDVKYTLLNGLRVEIIRNNSKYNKLSLMQLQKKDSRAIGIKHGNTSLLLLINRGLKLIGSDYGVNASYSYIDQNKTYNLADLVRDHLIETFIAVVLFIIFIILLFIFYIKGIKTAQRKTNLQLQKNRLLTRQLENNNKELEILNNKLRVAKEEAESANQSKTIFLNNMSHDIRTPMNAILGFTKLMETKINDPDLLNQYISKIEKSGEYLLELINNVLELARIDSGNLSIDNAFVDLTDPECSVYSLLENEINKNNLHFTCAMNITHKYVFTDMPKIREINMNLMSNAIKYTPEGGKIHLQFDEIPSDKEGYARYVNQISDTGIGMSEEFQKNIFTSFSRERNSTESKVPGSGLGMSIVKKLIDLLEGTIEVESKVGEGTTFKVTMYHKIVEDPDKYLSKQKNTITHNTKLEGKRILLAEDNALNAEIAVAILNGAGIEVDHAEDGIICIDMLRKATPDYYDLILMDIQMPNLNGYETTSKIRAAGFTIPIIAMTANAFEEDRQNVLKAEMNGFVAKPIDVTQLMKALNDVIK